MKGKSIFSIRDMCEIAMLVALAVVLDQFCKIPVGENGGSISISMVPLFLICYRHGLIKGAISSGLIFGFITNLLDGYGFLCFPFDYLLACGSLCIVSLFTKKIFENKSKVQPYIFVSLSIIIACALRLTFHVISGMVLYGLDFVGSFVYNFAYVGPSCLICIVIFIVFLELFKQLNNTFPIFKNYK